MRRGRRRGRVARHSRARRSRCGQIAPTPNHELEQLFAAYAEDRVPGFVDAKALAAFARRGDDAWSRGLLGEARELNPHIPVYLTGAKKLPEPRPAHIVLGEERLARLEPLLERRVGRRRAARRSAC